MKSAAEVAQTARQHSLQCNYKIAHAIDIIFCRSNKKPSARAETEFRRRYNHKTPVRESSTFEPNVASVSVKLRFGALRGPERADNVSRSLNPSAARQFSGPLL